MELGLSGSCRPSGGEHQVNLALGCALGVNGDANRQRGAVERKDLRFRRNADANLRRYDQRLKDTANAALALHGLHNFAEQNGQAFVAKLSPGGQRIGREGAAAPGGI